MVSRSMFIETVYGQKAAYLEIFDEAIDSASDEMLS